MTRSVKNSAAARGLTRLAVVIMVAVIAIVSIRFLSRSESVTSEVESLRRASLLLDSDNVDQAEMVARNVIQQNPRCNKAHLLAAECAIQRKDFDTAVADLQNIGKEDPDTWLSARHTLAELLHYSLARLGDAETAYRDILKLMPRDAAANEELARLLSLCGRREEAIPLVLALIRHGETTDLLVLLARTSGSISDPELLRASRQADPDDPNPLLGLANAAVLSDQPDEAIGFFQQAAQLAPLPADAHGRLGQLLMNAGRVLELEQWVQQSSSTPSAAGWLVKGQLAVQNGNRRGAIRCFWEASRLSPELTQTHQLLAQQLMAEGETELAASFLQRVEQLNQLRDNQNVVLMTDYPAPGAMLKMIQSYQTVGRIWEAYAWIEVASQNFPTDSRLQTAHALTAAKLDRLLLQQTASDSNPACQIDLTMYEVPAEFASSVTSEVAEVSTDIFFRSEGKEVGFDFQFFNGSHKHSYRMFELTGGGVAVLDFDNDSWPDVFCSQGVEWELRSTEKSRRQDRLFRNLRGNQFSNLPPGNAMPDESEFGQGVSVGDVNSDGFDDLYVANIGPNKLWINNGDGTFSDASPSLAQDVAEWTTSCLIADLNNDSIPDIYDVNYLSGKDIFERLCAEDNGQEIMCSPFDFDGAVDCLRLGDGKGSFHDATKSHLKPAPAGKGLGIAAFRTGGDALSVFVANDTTANFFYTPSKTEPGKLTDSATRVGLAYNNAGKAEACMGVAIADCNHDSHLDVFVTNFMHESNTLYSLLSDPLYSDRTREFGLHDSSLPVLGFGTQFLDANCDGNWELFIANGYTQDLSRFQTPYRMKPQMHEWTGQRFQQLPKSPQNRWATMEIVGRATARLDWNNDGLPDLAVGLLDDPSCLLTNESKAVGNARLTISLVAVDSARDAIGTTVTVDVGGDTYVHQLTAGDGFQCSNDRRLIIGLGAASQAEKLTIHWPSGRRQVFEAAEIPQSSTIVEGRAPFSNPL